MDRIFSQRVLLGVVMSGWLTACTFSNNLDSGDYVQQPKVIKASMVEKAGFYVTCTTLARDYDQVIKSSNCNALSLSSIIDASVQEEILGHFHSLSFDESLGIIHTEKQESVGASKQVHLHVHQDYGWPRVGFQALLSTLTLTLVPLNYPRDYTLTLSIENADGKIEKSASRHVRMDNWWWFPLMFSYPFYNEKRASENILLHTGRDLVRELESP